MDKIQSALIIPDTHFQPFLLGRDGSVIKPESCHDSKALSIFFQVANDLAEDQNREISQIIHIGDICEMATISHWSESVGKGGQVKGSDGEWYKSMWKDQMEMTRTFWAYLHQLFPNAEKHQLEGNHDFWSDNAFSRAPLSIVPELAFRNWSVWKDFGIKLYKYDGDQKKDQPWVDVGKYRILHGYTSGGSIGRMLTSHDNVIYGHTHKVLTKEEPRSSREIRVARSIGCLSELRPTYACKGGNQCGYSHAFAIINTAPTGQQDVEVVNIVDYCIPYYNGKTYYSKPLNEIDQKLVIFDKVASSVGCKEIDLNE